jgi:methionyl-tRNA formyltransferase
LRILFFGSDRFAETILDTLVSAVKATISGANKHAHIEVVCPSDKRQGRGMKLQSGPVKQYAVDHFIPIHEVDDSIDFSMNGWELPSFQEKFDIGVVVSFGYRIPDRIINSFPLGMVNFHPSLLPQYVYT